MLKVYAHDSYALLGLTSLLSEVEPIQQCDTVVLVDHQGTGIPVLLQYWVYRQVACIILTKPKGYRYFKRLNTLIVDISLPTNEIKNHISHFITTTFLNGQFFNHGTEMTAGHFASPLTHTEIRIVKYICKGVSPAMIAKKENISVKTVSLRKRQAMQKMNIRTTQNLLTAFRSHFNLQEHTFPE